MHVLGFMTGTSLDAVDMAILETDGETIAGFGPAGERKLEDGPRELLAEATRQARVWQRGEDEPAIFRSADRLIADLHYEAAVSFLAHHNMPLASIDLVGFHGQTVLHEPPTADREGRTIQLGDAGRLARRLGVAVAHDFRTADVEAGGQGAPLAPVYHRARAAASRLAPPLAVLNLGGVGNITLIGADGELTAFDTGPANGMIDQWVQMKTGVRCDRDGRLAFAGSPNKAALAELISHPYFTAFGPKSLDRFDFSLDPVASLGVEDATATLTYFAAEAVRMALERLPVSPRVVVACGGGRHNPALMGAISERSEVPVLSAEEVHWRGDAIEAEAFAFLAARTLRHLPISFPGTTGVDAPMTGGRVVRP